jgi:hypothetical protein
MQAQAKLPVHVHTYLLYLTYMCFRVKYVCTKVLRRWQTARTIPPSSQHHRLAGLLIGPETPSDCEPMAERMGRTILTERLVCPLAPCPRSQSWHDSMRSKGSCPANSPIYRTYPKSGALDCWLLARPHAAAHVERLGRACEFVHICSPRPQSSLLFRQPAHADPLTAER